MPQRRISAVHRALGNAFNELPLEVQQAHDNEGHIRLSGSADVNVKPGLFPRLLCFFAGLPRTGRNQTVAIDFFSDETGIDRWVRNFNGRMYQSKLWAANGVPNGKLVERLGPFTTIFTVAARSGRLTFDTAKMRAFGIPLPRFLVVRCQAFETAEAGAFVFDITIRTRLIGDLIHYRGKLFAD